MFVENCPGKFILQYIKATNEPIAIRYGRFFFLTYKTIGTVRSTRQTNVGILELRLVCILWFSGFGLACNLRNYNCTTQNINCIEFFIKFILTFESTLNPR